MQYEVQAVGDDELPEGVHWLAVENGDGPPTLFINGDPARCWEFMQATQDLREPCTLPTTLLPAPLLRAV
jgi:hypothetical protein